MTKRDVSWEDSGFDCDHCGGEILKRSNQTTPEKEQYFQCSQCGCRWAVSGEIIHIGNGPLCQQSSYQSQPVIISDKRMWWVGAGISLLILLFFAFGGAAVFSFAFALVRFLIPLGILVLIGMAIYWVGKQQGFWQ